MSQADKNCNQPLKKVQVNYNNIVTSKYYFKKKLKQEINQLNINVMNTLNYLFIFVSQWKYYGYFKFNSMNKNQKQLLSEKQVTKFKLLRNQNKTQQQRSFASQYCPINFVEKSAGSRNSSSNRSNVDCRNHNLSLSKSTKQVMRAFKVNSNQESSLIIHRDLLKQQVQSLWNSIVSQSCQQYQINTPLKVVGNQSNSNHEIVHVNISIKSLSVLRNSVKHTFELQIKNQQYIKVHFKPSFILQKITINNKLIKLQQLDKSTQNKIKKGLYIVNPFQLIQNARKLINAKLCFNQPTNIKNSFIHFVNQDNYQKSQQKICNFKQVQTPKVKQDKSRLQIKNLKHKSSLSSQKTINRKNDYQNSTKCIQKNRKIQQIKFDVQKSSVMKQNSMNKCFSETKNKNSSHSSLLKNTVSSASKQTRINKQNTLDFSGPKIEYFSDSKNFKKDGKTIYPYQSSYKKLEKKRPDQGNTSHQYFQCIVNYGMDSSSSKKLYNSRKINGQKLLFVKKSLIQSRKL